jgi:hypothetical protein
MGMGSYACDSYVISYKNLKKLCPKEIEAIETAKYWEFVGWGSLAKGMSYQDTETIGENLCDSPDNLFDTQVTKISKGFEKLTKQLYAAFKKRTGGLELFLDYYNEDEGDRYDSLEHEDGCVFCVGNVVQLTPAGKKFQKVVDKRRWVQFG